MPAGSYGKSLGLGKGMMDEDEESEPVDPMAMGEEEETEDGGDVPPDFQAAYDDYMESPTAKSMYDMIEACKAGGEKPGGLALILGGKGKK